MDAEDSRKPAKPDVSPGIDECNISCNESDDAPTAPPSSTTPASEHGCCSPNPTPNPVPETITIPRTRGTSQPAQQSGNGSGSGSSSHPTGPPARRSPSKAPRKSIDGRPLVRSTTKISVRMKPRSVIAAAAAVGQSPAAAAQPTVASGRKVSSSSSSAARRISSQQAGSGHAAASAAGRGRSTSRQQQQQQLKSESGSPFKTAAPGVLRPRFSVSYRLARPPRSPALSSAEPSPLSLSSPAVAAADQQDSGGPNKKVDDGTGSPPAPDGGAEEATQKQPSSGASEPCRSTAAADSKATLYEEAKRLKEAWREVQRMERGLKVREDALKLGLKRLRLDREAMEKEKKLFRDEQRRFREEVEESRKCKDGRKRSRSRSRVKTRCKAEVSYGKTEQQHHHHTRNSSWSSIDDSGEDYETTTTTTTGTTTATAATFDKDHDDEDATENDSVSSTISSNSNSASTTPPLLSWASPAPSLVASYQTYNRLWTTLPKHSRDIPYPSPNHRAAELHMLSHMPDMCASAWSTDALVKYNAALFFATAHALPIAPAADAQVAKIGLGMVSDDGLKKLVSAVRVQLRRWHEDSLKYRSGSGCSGGGGGDGGGGGAGKGEGGEVESERKVNEELVSDETARAVFRAFTELRDAFLTEARGRKERAAAKGDKPKSKGGERCGGDGPSSSSGGSRPAGERGGGCYYWCGSEDVDWTVLSEAML